MAKMTFVVKCSFRATAVNLKFEAHDADEALARAAKHRMGRKAWSYKVIGQRG